MLLTTFQTNQGQSITLNITFIHRDVWTNFYQNRVRSLDLKLFFPTQETRFRDILVY
jgi:hypothetical protein